MNAWHETGRARALLGPLSIAAAALALTVGACSSGPETKAKRVEPVVRDVSPALRGTIGSEVTILGIQPTLVSGYGLVVGLNGTGGQPLNEALQATMERDAGLNGVTMGSELGPNNPVSGKSPRELLRDPNVAVVLVQAAIPPGSAKGSRFDVSVRAMNASSLEGGTLWTTELRFGPPGTFGQVQSRKIAEARGPIFVNPFLEEEQIQGETLASDFNLEVGRVLGGGAVTEPLEIELVMDSPSYLRARTIVAAINSRFPEAPGDRGPTARGLSGGNYDTGRGGRLAVQIPVAYRTNSDEFLRILQGVQIDPNSPEEYCRRYVAALKAEPALADELSYCLEGIGPKALPFLRELYNSDERSPQLAALRAGVGLNDAMATPTLMELARSGPEPTRIVAISLLGAARAGPRTDLALQALLNENGLLVRIAAYEALALRAERNEFARRLELRRPGPETAPMDWSTAAVQDAAMMSFAPSIQGVERTCIGCGMGRPPKFILDVVPFGDPLVYITQQGLPRIVLFGATPGVSKPVLATAWSNRLVFTADSPTDEIRVSYKRSQSARAFHSTAPDDLKELIEFLARDTTPEDPRPGLGLRFSEVVGALYALYRDGGTAAAFATERDRLLATIMAASKADGIRQRPETTGDTENVIVMQRQAPKPNQTAEPGSLVKPLEPKKPDR